MATVLAAALAGGGCDDPGGPVVGATPPAVTLPSTSPAGVAPNAAAATYRANDLELCARTDRSPLADLKLSVRRTDPKPPPSAPGAACLFEMRTADGHDASLRVEAATPPSTEDAERLYRTTARVTGMSPDGDVTGLGEEAVAFSKQSTGASRHTEYMIRARTGNLVVKVWLTVGGDSSAAKVALADKVRAIAEATLRLVPTA